MASDPETTPAPAGDGGPGAGGQPAGGGPPAAAPQGEAPGVQGPGTAAAPATGPPADDVPAFGPPAEPPATDEGKQEVDWEQRYGSARDELRRAQEERNKLREAHPDLFTEDGTLRETEAPPAFGGPQFGQPQPQPQFQPQPQQGDYWQHPTVQWADGLLQQAQMQGPLAYEQTKQWLAQNHPELGLGVAPGQQAPPPPPGLSQEEALALFDRRYDEREQAAERFYSQVEVLRKRFGDDFMDEQVRLADGRRMSREDALVAYCQRRGNTNPAAAILECDADAVYARLKAQARADAQAEDQRGQAAQGVPVLRREPPDTLGTRAQNTAELERMGWPTGPPQPDDPLRRPPRR